MRDRPISVAAERANGTPGSGAAARGEEEGEAQMISAWWLLLIVPASVVVAIVLAYVGAMVGIAKGLNW